MNQNNFSVLPSFSSVTMTGTNTITSGAIRIRDYVGFSVHTVWTGTATGTLKIQYSNDTGNAPTNWEDITSVSYSVTAAGSKMFNVADAFYAWIRVVYINATNTGTITVCNVQGKGYN